MPKAIFNITYTCPEPPAKYRGEKRAEYIAERNFYNMTAKYNYLAYTSNGEKVSTNATADKYFSRTGTGVFDGNGAEYTEKDLKELKANLKNSKSIIWHGFISFDQETSKLFTEKSQAQKFVKQTFGGFLERTHLKKDNVQMFCSLHVDKSTHHHIHFAFYEKKPIHRDKNGILGYTRMGKISPIAIENYLVSMNMHLDENGYEYYTARDRAIDRLKVLRGEIKDGVKKDVNITALLTDLCKKLPKSGRLQYNSENLIDLRPNIDKVASYIISSDKTASAHHKDMLFKLAQIKGKTETLVRENKLVYIDPKELSENVALSRVDYFTRLMNDYKARVGNLVLGMCKDINKRSVKDRRTSNTVNNKVLKMQARRAVELRKALIKNFYKTFSGMDGIQGNYLQTVQQIEQEMTQEKTQEN